MASLCGARPGSKSRVAWAWVSTRLVLPAVFVLGLAGCSKAEDSWKVDESFTVQQAKAENLAMLDELIGLVPKEAVAEVSKTEEMVLFVCGDDMPAEKTAADRTIMGLDGFASIYVEPGTDIDQVLRDLRDHYRDSRFAVEEDHSSVTGRYRVQLVDSEHSDHYLIAHSKKRNGPEYIEITATSQCFRVPAEMMHDDYY